MKSNIQSIKTKKNLITKLKNISALSLLVGSMISLMPATVLGSDIFPATDLFDAGSNTAFLDISVQLKSTDIEIYKAYPKDYTYFYSPGLPPDKTYRLGRNYQWQGIYSPRWQLYSGKALRLTLASGSSDLARKAFLALKLGSDAIAVDGSIPFQLPTTMTGTITPEIVAQSASFYLGEACLAVKALSQYPTALVQKVASENELSNVKESLTRGYYWLKTQDSVLYAADYSSPNRLLFDALAFQACGSLVDDNEAQSLVDSYIANAMEFLSIEGYFIEAGGWDTHYQAINIVQGNDILLAGYSGTHMTLLTNSLYQGAKWLESRVDTAGIVHSEGNTRTCWNGETILNVDKLVDPREIWRALEYTGVINDDISLQESASRVAAWIRKRPSTTCVL